MALLNTSIPNLAQGVSQQPSNLRFAGQADEQINGYSSIIEGLVKRPNSRHIAKLLSSSISTNSFVGTIDRGSGLRYLVVVEPSSSILQMWNLESGASVTVTNTNAYLSHQNPKDGLKMITVADTTFLLNKTTNVTTAVETSDAYAHKALVFIKQAAYNKGYTVSLNGSSFTATVSSSTEVKSSEILSVIKSGTGPTHVTYSGTSGGLDGVTGLTVALGGSVLQMSQSSAFTNLFVKDDLSNTGMGVAYLETSHITDLPAKAYGGFRIKITGEVSKAQDDYYVTFKTKDDAVTFGEGSWAEDIAPSIKTSLNASTMPVKLSPTSVSAYTLSNISWVDRVVGDDGTNPVPSFVSTATKNVSLNDIFFFKNRLGFITNENVILSEAGEYFNFFRITTLSLLDSAPIDVSVAHPDVTSLLYGVPFQEKLLIISNNSQFVLRGNDLLTPKTVNISPVTAYTANQYPAPLSLGGFVYFAFSRGNSQGVREYNLDEVTGVYDANEITAHVPKYIPNRIDKIVGSTSENILVCTTSANKKFLYVYKYFWQNREKLQSAWSRFEFKSDIVGADFVNSDLYITIADGTNTYLEIVPMEVGNADTSYNILLDSRVYYPSTSTDVAYDTSTLKTTISNLSYDPIDLVVYTKSGTKYSVTKVDATTATLAGDLSSTDFYIGYEYTMEYQFSEQVLKQPTSRGGKASSAFTSQILRNLSIDYFETGHFTVEVSPLYKDSFTYSFSPVQLGADFVLDSLTLEDGSFRVPVHANPKEVTIKAKSSSALPVKLLAAEFESFTSSRSRRYAG